jgi:hypothetical protein
VKQGQKLNRDLAEIKKLSRMKQHHMQEKEAINDVRTAG